ncbi:MAG TPA: AraC family transcriptional regulator [Steroidobacteraceae bacterium]|nr:AraC family transcriptional regulator [Steroidobacteraceae bacterium]
MSLVNRALFMIERNLHRDLSLGGIAEACGVSRFHLAHAFGEATGVAVMEYVRRRRLTESAYALASGATGIMEVALDSGYDSHEGFTRAFKAYFGRTPEEIRRAESVVDLARLDAIRFIEARRAKLAAPTFERAGELKFVGLGEPFDFGETAHIPKQWGRFMAEFYPKIGHKSQQIPLGIVTSSSDGATELRYTCAVEVSRFTDIEEGLVRLTVGPASYAVFSHDGHISELPQTYAAIWNDWLPANGGKPAEGPSFERPNPTFDTRTGEGGVRLWIPLANHEPV